jgi:hypothetical protein
MMILGFCRIFVHSKYILLWACNTLGTNSHHWPFIEQAKKAGAKLVVIDRARARVAKGPFRQPRRRGDRATATHRHIWSAKIRGCSYRRGNTTLPHRTMLHRTIT